MPAGTFFMESGHFNLLISKNFYEKLENCGKISIIFQEKANEYQFFAV